MANEVKVNGGIGFTGLLTIVFIVLKLTSVVSWSWWWVTAPLWFPAAFAFLLIVVWIIAYMFDR